MVEENTKQESMETGTTEPTPEQELKKRNVQKPATTENDDELEKVQEGGEEEGEEDEESEYEYEFAPTTSFYVICIGAVVALIGFLIFINLNYPASHRVKDWLIGSLVHFKQEFFMKKVYIAALGIFIFFQIATALSNAILEHFNISNANSNNKDVNEFSGSSVVGAFLIIGILFPVAEELIFRKVIFGGLSLLFKPLAYIVSSFLFAFYHFEFSWEKLKEEIGRFPLYLLAGVMFAFVYDYTGCILATMLGHILNNSKTVILSLFGVLQH